MQIKNKRFAQEGLRNYLDNLIKGYELLRRHYHSEDESVFEWSEEEKSEYRNYLDICCLDTYDNNRMFLSNVLWAARILELPVKFIEREDSDYPFQIEVEYKGYTFFCLDSNKGVKEEYEQSISN